MENILDLRYCFSCAFLFHFFGVSSEINVAGFLFPSSEQVYIFALEAWDAFSGISCDQFWKFPDLSVFFLLKIRVYNTLANLAASLHYIIRCLKQFLAFES